MAFPDTDLDVIVEAFLGANLNDDPGTWPSATDLSSRLLDNPISITTGRRQNQRTAAAGSCSFWLDNEDGYLTPLLASSPYYGTWDLGTPVRLSVDNVGASPPYPQFCGYVADISVEIVPTVGGRSTSAVKVTLSGLIRRLGQGKAPRSALTRALTLSTASLVALWPLEEGDQSPVPLPYETYGLPGVVVHQAGWQPGAVGPPGAAACLYGTTPPAPPIVHDSSAVTLPVGDYTDTGELTITMQVRWDPMNSSQRADESRTADLVHMLRFDTGGTLGYLWIGFQVNLSTPTAVAGIYGITYGHDRLPKANGSADDTVAGNNTTIWDDRAWHEVQFRITDQGATTDVALYFDGILRDTLTGVVATLGKLTQIQLGARGFYFGDSSQTNDTAEFQVCHVSVHNDNGVGSFYEALIGHAGEQAHDRFVRVMTEEGLPYTCTATESREVGPQPVGDVLDIVRDLETVDHGFLSELLSTWGLGYRPASQRYNLSPSMTIDLATYRVKSGESRDVLQPVRNDVNVINEWTITRPGGSPQTVRDEASIARYGRRTAAATVNVVDDDAAYQEAAARVGGM